MEESREQFRQRLNKQYWATYYDTMHKTGHIGSTRAEEHAAEAVYAAALRDARQAFKDDPNDEPYNKVDAVYVLDDLAASLGIDLVEGKVTWKEGANDA